VAPCVGAGADSSLLSSVGGDVAPCAGAGADSSLLGCVGGDLAPSTRPGADSGRRCKHPFRVNHSGGPASPRRPRQAPQSSSRSDTPACLRSNPWRTRAIKAAPHNPLGLRRMAGGNPWPTLATAGCDGGSKRTVSWPVFPANFMVYYYRNSLITRQSNVCAP
jgi:hypothetical protein